MATVFGGGRDGGGAFLMSERDASISSWSVLRCRFSVNAMKGVISTAA